MEVEFATLYRGGKPVNRNVRIQAKEQRDWAQRLVGLEILTERDLKEWERRNEESMKGKWETIEGVVDSGAVDTVTNKVPQNSFLYTRQRDHKEVHSGTQRTATTSTMRERN